MLHTERSSRLPSKHGGMDMTIRFLLGLTIGMLVGASFALALAPQGGAETRQQLWNKAAERVGQHDAG